MGMPWRILALAALLAGVLAAGVALADEVSSEPVSIEAVEEEYEDILPRVSGRDWQAELQRVLDRAAGR